MTTLSFVMTNVFYHDMRFFVMTNVPGQHIELTKERRGSSSFSVFSKSALGIWPVWGILASCGVAYSPPQVLPEHVREAPSGRASWDQGTDVPPHVLRARALQKAVVEAQDHALAHNVHSK